MTVSRRVFVSSATFAAIIAIVYWYLTREPVGTMMLGFMASALSVVAVYMLFAESDADLWGDKKEARMADAAGEHVGTYVTHSPAPFWIGVAIAGIVLGLVVSPAAAGLGIVALLFLVALMIVRSK